MPCAALSGKPPTHRLSPSCTSSAGFAARQMACPPGFKRQRAAPETTKPPGTRCCPAAWRCESGRDVWLRGLDLNQRPSGYEPDELPGCSTPRQVEGECTQRGPG